MNLTITDIRLGKKNTSRVNIFVDNKYSFSLSLPQLADEKLKIGQIKDETELERLKKLSNFGKLYQRTVEYVFVRPRSVKEVRDYLIRKKMLADEQNSFSDEDIEKIIEKIIEKGWLSDMVFARFFIENKNQKKGISRRKLYLELAKKGVNREIVDKVFSEDAEFRTIRSDDEEIMKIIERKKRRGVEDDRLITYLVRQGFSYSLARGKIAEFSEAE